MGGEKGEGGRKGEVERRGKGEGVGAGELAARKGRTSVERARVEDRGRKAEGEPGEVWKRLSVEIVTVRRKEAQGTELASRERKRFRPNSLLASRLLPPFQNMLAPISQPP